MEILYRGFHEDNELPIRLGQTIQIPKGTIVEHRGQLQETKRSYRVRVDHVLNGMSYCVGYWHKPTQTAHFSFVSRYDRERVKELYGTDDLSQLWPLMSVRGGNIFLPIINPQVRWAGKGGYWSAADINQLL